MNARPQAADASPSLLTGDDRATIFDGLLSSAGKLKSDQGERVRALWAAKGKQAFEADRAARKGRIKLLQRSVGDVRRQLDQGQFRQTGGVPVKKLGARLASPQPRPTRPVNGAGGITGWQDDSQPKRSFLPGSFFFDFFSNVAMTAGNLWALGRVDVVDRSIGTAGQEMSRLVMGISSALVLTLISGAAEFARGRDLPPLAGNSTPITQALALRPGLPAGSASSVNRGSKADRAAVSASSSAMTRTVSLKFDAFADTTFLVRVPVAIANPPAVRAPTEPTTRRPMVACELAVSVLAEAAKQLPAGRCVT